MDDENIPSPLVLSQAAPVGGKRATLALIVALAALGFSIYGLAVRLFEPEKPVVAQVTHENVSLGDIQSRLQAIEERQGHFAEDLAKIEAPAAEGQAKPAAEAPAPKTDEMDKKLELLGKDASTLRNHVENVLVQKAGALADLALVQSIRSAAQEGMDSSALRKRLDEDVAALPGGGDTIKALDGLAAPASLSDLALREDLRSLAPSFTALQKLGKADSFFAKLGLRLQSLVTIRPREGIAQDGSDVGKVLAALENAMAAHDWKSALPMAEALRAKAPPEFVAWHERLKTRASADLALDRVEEALLVSLRGVKEKEEAPAASGEGEP